MSITISLSLQHIPIPPTPQTYSLTPRTPMQNIPTCLTHQRKGLTSQKLKHVLLKNRFLKSMLQSPCIPSRIWSLLNSHQFMQFRMVLLILTQHTIRLFPVWIQGAAIIQVRMLLELTVGKHRVISECWYGCIGE